MRPAAALTVLWCLLLAGCGGSGGGLPTRATTTDGGKTLKERWQEPGDNVAITSGTENHEPGDVRVSFLVLDTRGRPVSRPTARVWVARDLDAPSFLETTASLEQVGVPGGAEALAGTYYVSRFRIAKPGTYWLLAEPVGGETVHALGNVVVVKNDPPPDLGDPAIPSDTPTVASTGGDFSQLTTRSPPDVPLLRYSIADSLKAHAPFVVTFATPKFCASRTCGPTVDVVLAAEKRFRGKGIRFIHVEVYADNDPAKGYDRWMQEWKLETEPWTFLVDRKGRIAERFEGVVSVAELEQAIRDRLLAR